ncbi:hypothetical protein [Lusitaniella coriacea]|uniref:hypothetical protein n=1 Tax=Lusitaniella coriacea TaxID=1983105 RepID=UPI003CF7C6F3
MKLKSIEKKIDNNRVRIIGTIEVETLCKEIEIYFEYPKRFADCLSEDADAFVPALLLPAMEMGESLEIEPPISEKLFRNTRKIQDIFCQWHPENFKQILVFARNVVKRNLPNRSHVGAFFSLGVDSFYTFHKHIHPNNPLLPKISHLIHMKGIEFPLSYYKDDREQEVNQRIEEVARATNIDVVFGETNIRSHFPLKWGLYYHGAALASVALSLSGGFNSVLLPSTDSYKKIFHWGSSPLIDHLWSTENTELVHDGSEVERAEKTAKFLTQNALAMKYLRVCLKNYGGAGNCGKCTKCVRTMLPLEISGKLSMFQTFPNSLPKNWDKILEIKDEHDLAHAEAILDLAREAGAETQIVKTLSRKIETAKCAIFLQEQTFGQLIGSMASVMLVQPIQRQGDWLQEKLKVNRFKAKAGRLQRRIELMFNGEEELNYPPSSDRAT